MKNQAVDYEKTANLVEMFFQQAEVHKDTPFLWKVVGRAYQPLSWSQVRTRVVALASGLIDVGVKAGDRVVLVSENRPEWCIADLAIMAIGAITVPAYTTNTSHDHRHVLTDSGATAAIVSHGRFVKPLLSAAAHISHPPRVILMDHEDLKQNPGVPLYMWDDILERGAAKPASLRYADLTRQDIACIIYTSGTGGVPKGVMLSHGIILVNCMGAHDVLMELGLGRERFLSFLPLSHAYEHTAGQFFPIFLGAEIFYAEGLEALGRNMVMARPTLVTAVPRLYELMRMKMEHAVNKEGGWRARLFHLALSLGMKRHRDKLSRTFVEFFLDLLCDVTVRRKVRAGFGGQLKGFVSGGAPLNPDIGYFFTALGVRLAQGYGQTEAGPLVSVNRPFSSKMESVGQPLKGVEMKIAADGEICVRGAMVMQGYWNNPEDTAETIDAQGWLHTGDVGFIDDDGHVFITDRKKDIIVNSGGDNISPQRVEGFLTLEPEIAQAMVYGDRRPHLVAVLVPDDAVLRDITRAEGAAADLKTLASHPEVRRRLGDAVKKANRELSSFESIRRFIVADQPFTIENAMLTPTLKVRRHVIMQRWGEDLKKFYR